MCKILNVKSNNYLTLQSATLVRLLSIYEYLPLIAANSIYFKTSDFSLYKIGTNLNNRPEFEELKRFMYAKIKGNINERMVSFEKAHLMCFFLRDNCYINNWNALPLANFKYFGLIKLKIREDVKLNLENSLNISNDEDLILIQDGATIRMRWSNSDDYSKHSIFAVLWC